MDKNTATRSYTFWERLIGCHNEDVYRVFFLFGFKIRIRSKVLILRKKTGELTEANKAAHRACGQLQIRAKELKATADQQQKAITGLEKQLAELQNALQVLQRFSNAERENIAANQKEVHNLKQALEKTCGVYDTSLSKIRETLKNQEIARQKLDKKQRDDTASLSAEIRQLQQKATGCETRLTKAEESLAAGSKRMDWMKNDYVQRMAAIKRETTSKIYKYSDAEKLPLALADWYFETTGNILNLKTPSTYNEKIQWMKAYDTTPVKTQLADKYQVREWVKKRIGEQYLIPLLGVWERFSDIDFSTLPERFVLKCNHGCGYNIIVKDKNELNIEAARKKIEYWMQVDFAFRVGFELQYSTIPRRIIAEEFIENEGSEDGDLYDYKFWCFDGKVKYIQFLSERNTNGLKMAFYDTDWKKQNFVYSYPLDTKDMPRPENLDEMITVAEKLAEGFSHVRVDLYRLDNGKLYFGEMTFTPASGLCKWQPAEMDEEMGTLITLPILPNTQKDALHPAKQTSTRTRQAKE